MTEDTLMQMRSIQTSMRKQASAGFTEGELDALRTLIRLVLEFKFYLGDIGSRTIEETRYISESIFSGIPSFSLVCASYRVLAEQTESYLDGDQISVSSIKEEFDRLCQDFIVETKFSKRCRLLLDLFKLEIMFAGLVYQ